MGDDRTLPERNDLHMHDAGTPETGDPYGTFGTKRGPVIARSEVQGDVSDVTVAVHRQRQGQHVHLRVFVGPAGATRALAGTLVLRPDEADVIEDALLHRRLPEIRQASAALQSGVSEWQQYVSPALVPQLDLLAMQHGYVFTAEPWDEHPDEYVLATLTRHTTPGGSSE